MLLGPVPVELLFGVKLRIDLGTVLGDLGGSFGDLGEVLRGEEGGNWSVSPAGFLVPDFPLSSPGWKQNQKN